MTYDIVHTTRYEYTESVSVSQHVARLSPRTLPHQICHQHELTIDPPATITAGHVDYFGNPVTFFAMEGGHRRLTVRARSRVTVTPVAPPDAVATPAWETAADRAAMPLEALDCLFDVTASRPGAGLVDYARESFPPGRPLLEAVLDLTARIHSDFTFDPTATTIATPVAEVFASRRGVCQDFARLEIACLRATGLPARYVSGYLETVPAPGRTKLRGADVSHAWLSAYCPGAGWIDVDPTNNLIPGGTHVTLAYGRDYGDVSPLRGVMLGGGAHTLLVSVDVAQAEAGSVEAGGADAGDG